MTSSSLPRAAGTVAGEVAGREVVLSYGDPVAEYEALRTGAMLVDRGDRLRMAFTGDQAAETLTGLVTNDVVGLQPGEGQYAAALTAKGKIIADVRILRQADRLIVDVPPRAAEGWTAMVRKYVNPRLARYTDLSATLRDVGIFGVQSRRIVAELTGVGAATLQVLPLHGHVTAHLPHGPVIVARVPDLGLEGYELFATPELLADLWTRAVNAGATPAGLEAWDVARIEAGRPEWGIDISDAALAQEANLDELHAISYTKGCYTGQETVARVHFRGHVNRHLRGIVFEGDDVAPPKSTVTDVTGKMIGDVRSGAVSPRLGPIALAMIRREAEVGAAVKATWDDGERSGRIVRLPFPD